MLVSCYVSRMRRLYSGVVGIVLMAGLAACASRPPAPIDYRGPVPSVSAPSVPKPIEVPTVAGPAKPKPKPRPVVENPREVTVAAGQTLFDVAEAYRVPVRSIIEINGLQPPFDVKTGQKLILPPPLTYKVVKGDTLMGISRRFNIDANSLGVLNGLARPFTVQAGQIVALPALARDAGPNAEASGPGPSSLTTPTRVVEAPAPKPAPVSTPAPSPVAGKPAVVAAVPTGKARFIWPVKGRVISTFGPKGPGQRNDGINIIAAEGDPVRAAGEGTVAYAGSELASFGNLVLVRHTGAWVTAYAHLSKMLVKEGQKVKAGQVIGHVGKTGNVAEPQLHFETRLNARPVDPTPQLPTS